MVWFMEILREKASNIAKNPKYDGYQRGLASLVYKLFDKNSTGSGVNTHANNEGPLDLATQTLAEELRKPIIRKFKKRTVYWWFKDNTWGADLADIKGITITNAFQKILKESNRKLNKIWVDKGSKF